MAPLGLRNPRPREGNALPEWHGREPIRPPLQREHRLYQADWLLRFYGFDLEDITGHRTDGNLDLEIDPKLAWALAHRAHFPLDVNRAPREMLLRVPVPETHEADLAKHATVGEGDS